MKTRVGFVSNSSTTSFICDVCGRSEAGQDLSISECDMRECRNGHTFCIKHETGKISIADRRDAVQGQPEYMLSTEEREEILALSDEDFEEWWEGEGEDVFYDVMSYEYPPEWCPLCRFKVLSPRDAIAYMKKKHGLTDEDLAREMQQSFSSYDDFKAFLEGSDGNRRDVDVIKRLGK